MRVSCFLKSWFVILFLIDLMTANAHGVEYRIIQRFSQIAVPIDSSTLVVLDLDETVMKPRSFHGSKEWYNLYVSHVASIHNSLRDAHDHAMEIWNDLQTSIEMVPLDPLIEYWVQLMHSGTRAGVIGLTARRESIREVTHRQLNQLSVSLREVIFVGEYAPKGPALSAFIHNWEQQNNHKIRRVIFVDDVTRNLASVAESMAALNIETHLFLLDPHCSAQLVGFHK